MTCKAVAESAVSGLRASCRTALQQSVPPPAVDPGKKLAAAPPGCAASCEFLGEAPLAESRTADTSANRSTRRRPTPHANSAAETASAANSSGKPMLAAAAACRVPLQTRLLRRTGQLLCKKLLTRLCKHCAAGTAAVLQSCEFFGEALACNVSFQL